MGVVLLIYDSMFLILDMSYCVINVIATPPRPIMYNEMYVHVHVY